MIVLALSFQQLGFQQDMTVVKSLGLLIILLAGLIISLILCVSLIPNEMERRTIYTILSKPVNRYEFVVGKFLGGILTLLVNIGLMGIVFVVMIMIKAAMSGDVATASKAGQALVDAGQKVAAKPDIFDPSLLIGILMIYLQAFLFSAVIMFFSVFLTPTVNYFASAGVYMIGSGSSIWASLASGQNKDIGPVVKGFYWVISRIIPNFDYYNVQNKLIHPQIEVRSMPQYLAYVIGYALIFSLVLMIISVLFFQKKEV
jgi:ABC-type transport system involved in multi-copper enzyme maturation permease subunit